MDNTGWKLIIFDVDGTLTKTKSGKTFRDGAADWEWLPGRKEHIQALRSKGVHCVIASNQGGVAYGLLKMEEIRDELHKLAKEAGIPPGGVYICYNHPGYPDSPNARQPLPEYRFDDHRRKPGPGMIMDAMVDFEAFADETLCVGDRPEDEGAAKRAGVSFVWASDFFGENSPF